MSAAEQRLRRSMLMLSGVMFLGTPIELWAAEHTESRTQYIPFVLCGLGFVVVVANLLLPRRKTLFLLRGMMGVVTAGSLLGIYEHISGNFAFELEIRPNATHSDVVLEALKGVNPLLAPGILAVAAAIALLAAAHPSPS
jgi:hypothetical protein